MGNQNGNGDGKNDMPTTERQGKGGEQNITPITFETATGNNLATDQKMFQNDSLKNSNTVSQLSRFTAAGPNKSSLRMESTLNLNKLSVIMENQELSGEINYSSVPFSVVRLSIDEKTDQCINKLFPQFYRQFMQNSQDNWRINSKGYYTKTVEPKKIVIMKPGYIYYGQYKQQGADYLPDGSGRLFTQRGMYVGSFKHGQAHGEGTYRDYIDSSVCKGTWINGEMRSGEIENKYYKFKGDFVDGIAQGKGFIQFNEHKASYKGHFHDGVYEDDNGYFECEQYDYSGAFKQGKKEGIGCLIQKQRFIQGKKRRYKPQEEFEGYFQNDYYKGRKKRVEK